MNNLSYQQTEIINAIEKHILVIACAGSGKTHTIINKYIHIINNNINNPDEIIMITFTNKAGIEMLNRIKLYMPDKLPFYIGTIHGLAYKILSTYMKIKPIIIDDDDISNIINNIMENLKKLGTYNCKEIIKVKKVIDYASTFYPVNLSKGLEKNNISIDKLDIYTRIYEEYKNVKKKSKLFDFNDLMIMFCKFLSDKKSTEFKNKLQYIFFDEYQDINFIQNYILKKLTKNQNCKMILVGDDSQSIYGFRGSSVDYILNFNKIFKNGKIYLLSTNFRSTESIVKLSQNIINKNNNKYDKEIITINKNNVDDKNNILKFNTINEQYKWVIEDIIKKSNSGIFLDNIVIIARTNKALDNFENYINKNYSEYHNKLIKNDGSILYKDYTKIFFAFIIYLINPKSILHLNRIKSLSSQTDMEYNKVFKSIRKENNNSDKINKIIKYLSNFYNNDIIKILQNMIPKNINEIQLKDFINNIYLNDMNNNNFQNSILLTTAHSSKGLEWEHVYIIDVNKKEFPSLYSEIEEERRVLYVAISRAKKNINITYYNESPFIAELT
jgi:DNA helicase-2/ATP-dependent DNA helicase PcrA